MSTLTTYLQNNKSFATNPATNGRIHKAVLAALG